MLFTLSSFPPINYFFWLIAVLTVLYAVIFAPWKSIIRVTQRQHLVFGSFLATLFIWYLSIPASPFLQVHLILITALSLIIGWHFAVIICTLSQCALYLAGKGNWQWFGMDFFCTILAPSAISALIFWITHIIKIRNLFIYLMGAGFFGAIFSAFTAATSALVLLYFYLDEPSLHRMMEDSLSLYLFMFPEGFINGTIVTAFSVFKPEWVKTFNDDFYLARKK